MKQTLRQVAQNLFRAHETGIYYARFFTQGKPRKRSLKTRRREIANAKLKDLRAQFERINPAHVNATFSEVVADFHSSVVAAKTLKAASVEDRDYRLKALQREWPNGDLARTPIRTIGRTDCERWMGKRRAQVGPQRLKNERSLLREIFRFAIREGYRVDDPTDRLPTVRVPPTRVVPPTRRELTQLIQHWRARGNEPAAELVELLAYSGLRIEEAASLSWADVDFKRSRFRVAGKGRAENEYDEVPLFPALRELLERIRQRRGDAAPQERLLQIRQCRDSLKAACQALKLSHFTHHSLRHYFCSEAIEQGVDFKVIAGWLRHKDGGVLVAKTYGHLRRDHSDDMAARMNFTVPPSSSGSSS